MSRTFRFGKERLNLASLTFLGLEKYRWQGNRGFCRFLRLSLRERPGKVLSLLFLTFSLCLEASNGYRLNWWLNLSATVVFRSLQSQAGAPFLFDQTTLLKRLTSGVFCSWGMKALAHPTFNRFPVHKVFLVLSHILSQLSQLASLYLGKTAIHF